MDIERWITTSEAARRIGVHQQYVIRLVHAGRIRAARTALGALLDPASVEAFRIERNRRKGVQTSERQVAEQRAEYIA